MNITDLDSKAPPSSFEGRTAQMARMRLCPAADCAHVHASARVNWTRNKKMQDGLRMWAYGQAMRLRLGLMHHWRAWPTHNRRVWLYFPQESVDLWSTGECDSVVHRTVWLCGPQDSLALWSTGQCGLVVHRTV